MPAGLPQDLCDLSIVIPCLDEAETIGACVAKAQAFLRGARLAGEVLVVDNGSRDGSGAIAAEMGARVIPWPEQGYGAALLAGFGAARGRYVVMGDADDTYDFSALGPFLERLDAGFDLVLGNRFRGGIAPGAMPFLHRYLGNPVLSWVGRLVSGVRCGDFHCGLRAFRREAVLPLRLRCQGMEFASEMVIVAAMSGLRITEVPTTLECSGRSRAPHLRTWPDGWRHLKYMVFSRPRSAVRAPGTR